MKKKSLISLVAVFFLIVMNVFVSFKITIQSQGITNYCGAGSFIDESETINYAKKETVSYYIKGEIPSYYCQTSNTNCANVAGTILIGYYDRFCEELIPNYKTYVQIGTIFKYKVGSAETQKVMESLYTSMETDVGTLGTTYEGFQKGMNSYVSSCNYSYTVNDVGNLNFNKFKTEVESNKPVAIFLNNYSYAVEGQDTGTSVVINSRHSYVAHVVIAYGYKVDTYYNANGQIIATRTYLNVASGMDEYKLTYLCLDGKSKIDRAISVIIQ